MDKFLKWWNDFYNTNSQMALVLIGAIGGAIATAIFSKLLPTLWSIIVNFIAFIGAKIGGRFGYKRIQNNYLNWVVVANQDLNLTGIIGSEEKPRLDQVFISLQISQESGIQKQSDIETDQLNSIQSLQEPISEVSNRIFQKLFRNISEFFRWIYKNISSSSKAIEGEIFRTSRIWRLKQIKDRDSFTLLILLSVVIIPIIGFIGYPKLDNPFAIVGLLAITLFDIAACTPTNKEKDKYFWGSFISYFLFPHIAFAFGIIQQIRLKQIPWVLIGIYLVVIVIFLFVLFIDRQRGKNEKVRKSEEIADLLTKDRIAILGKPGSGKSTYIQFIALTLAEEKAGNRKHRRHGIMKKRFGLSKWYLPILIPLRKIAPFITKSNSYDTKNLFVDAVRQEVFPSHISSEFSDEFIEYMLRNKKCLFLLDGIDEIANENDFRNITNEIMGLISRYPGNKFIITSRYSGWRGGLGSSFEQYDVNDLSNPEVENFIDRWFTAIEENRSYIMGKPSTHAAKLHRTNRAMEKANNLKRALQRNPSIKQLSENPLLLSIICFVHYQKILPDERISLYNKCSELLLDQWDREKGLVTDDTNLTPARKEAILEEIAFNLHCGNIGSTTNRKEFTEEEVIPIVEQILKKFRIDPDSANSLFKKLVSRSGVFVYVERLQNKYSFSHLTFQEYYTAKYLYEYNKNIFQEIDELANNKTQDFMPWWQEVLLLYSAMQKDAAWLVEILCCDDRFDLDKTKLQIAAQCLAEAISISDTGVEENVLKQLLEIRTNGKGCDKVNDIASEVRHYLLQYATTKGFNLDAIRLAFKKVQKNNLSKEFIGTVEKLLLVTDTSKVLNVLQAIKELGSGNKLAKNISKNTIDELLNSKNPDVQLATIHIVLGIFSIPQRKLYANRALEILLTRLPEKSISNAPINTKRLIEVLDVAFEGSTMGNLSIFQRKIEKIIFQTQFEEKVNYTLLQALVKALLKLDSTNQLNNHKQQIINMLWFGDRKQQLRAEVFLFQNFEDDPEIANILLSKLASPIRAIRRRVLYLIQSNLNLDKEQFSSLNGKT